jgi:transposase-like protein
MINDMNAPFPAPGGSAKARSAEADSPGAGAPPDPEVAAKPRRRQFTAAYRLRILEEADRCTTSGEIGQLLRREGLYSSHLSNWRKAQREGSLAALAPKKRGARPKARNPLEPKVRQLEAENARLKAELHKAHTILDVQEKVAGLLGFDLESGKNS